MFATVFNLPKWLLAVVALCIVAGHLQQLECRFVGCPSAVADTGATGQPDPTHGDSDCGCQCHVGTFAWCEFPRSFVALRYVREMKLVERVAAAPEAPCAEIEYPPRSQRA